MIAITKKPFYEAVKADPIMESYFTWIRGKNNFLWTWFNEWNAILGDEGDRNPGDDEKVW